jgi:hypothetical protein
MKIPDHHKGILMIALTHWIARCHGEAEQMRKWAEEMPHFANKCEANAKASENLARDAQAALDAL